MSKIDSIYLQANSIKSVISQLSPAGRDICRARLAVLSDELQTCRAPSKKAVEDIISQIKKKL